MQAVGNSPELLNISVINWEGTQRAHLDAVPSDTTVGEAVGEAARALELPFTDFFRALIRGREVNHGDTLDEIGIANEDEIELVPDVSAGC